MHPPESNRINPSPPLTPPQPHSLPILLQLSNQPVPLLDDIRILLILIVRPVRLDDLVDAVDGAGDAVCGYEFCEIAGWGMLAGDICWGKERGGTYRSRKSTETPKSFAMLPRPTTR